MDIESIQGQLEKLMVNPPRTATADNPYLAGYIDAMFDTGFLNKQQRATLFFHYAYPNEAIRLQDIFDKE